MGDRCKFLYLAHKEQIHFKVHAIIPCVCGGTAELHSSKIKENTISVGAGLDSSVRSSYSETYIQEGVMLNEGAITLFISFPLKKT